ncbi:MAG: hypothetical protein ACYDBJ_10255 [Aggregatilineales bacterium]
MSRACYLVFYASPDPTKLVFWKHVNPPPAPAYHIRYHYSWWGGERYVQADVYTGTRYGNWLLLSAMDPCAKAVYRAALRAIRAFDRYSDVNYSPSPTGKD